MRPSHGGGYFKTNDLLSCALLPLVMTSAVFIVIVSLKRICLAVWGKGVCREGLHVHIGRHPPTHRVLLPSSTAIIF